MTWLRESDRSWWHRFCCNVLKAGNMPRHIAFIMDGNRRFARRMGWSHILEGHIAGFEKLATTLEWCRDLDVSEVTVYAFSIENFKRSQAEVDDLLKLAEEKLKLLLDERDKVEKHEVCIRFYGNWDLLPKSMCRLMAKIMLLSRKHSRYYLNVCLAYTSTDEISRSISKIVSAVARKEIDIGDVNVDLVGTCLDTGRSPNPDLLVRTSGEQRFSDFMLWQSPAQRLLLSDLTNEVLMSVRDCSVSSHGKEEHGDPSSTECSQGLTADTERLLERLAELKLSNLKDLAGQIDLP